MVTSNKPSYSMLESKIKELENQLSQSNLKIVDLESQLSGPEYELVDEKTINQEIALKIFLALVSNSSITRTVEDVYNFQNREISISARTEQMIASSKQAAEKFTNLFKPKEQDGVQ